MVERLDALPQARDALAAGDLSLANAKTLTRAAETAGSAAVNDDAELLAKAASQAPEQFAREAKGWAAQRSADNGEDRYRRQRARRRLDMWTNEHDGMFNLRGEFDPVTGAKLEAKLRKEAEHLRRRDLNDPGGEQRNYTQRLADALDVLISGSAGAGSDKEQGLGGDRHCAALESRRRQGVHRDRRRRHDSSQRPRRALLQLAGRRDRVQQQGRAAVARQQAAPAHQSPDRHAHQALRVVRRLRRARRRVPGPSHRAALRGRAPQPSTISCCCAGTATTRSTTTAGESYPTANSTRSSHLNGPNTAPPGRRTRQPSTTRPARAADAAHPPEHPPQPNPRRCSPPADNLSPGGAPRRSRAASLRSPAT